MKPSSCICCGLAFGLLLAPGIGAGRAAPEKIPPDRLVHPLLKGVTQPQLIPEARKEPVYPEKWRKHRLGGKVIVQAVIEKSGSVREVQPLATRFWVETGCEEELADPSGDGSGEPDKKRPATPGGSGSTESTVPPEARRDFEAATVKAVKQWKYRPGSMSGVPVDVYFTIIVEFTSCPVHPPQGPSPSR